MRSAEVTRHRRQAAEGERLRIADRKRQAILKSLKRIAARKEALRGQDSQSPPT